MTEAQKLHQATIDFREMMRRAWIERAVTLSKLEREKLHHDLKETCTYLTDLTKYGP